MAYVDIPKDLDGIRSKVMLGLTKKQLIGFGVAAAVGIPVFLTTRVAVGNDFGLILMIASMALPLLYAIYEPKGMTVEQYAAAWLRFQFIQAGPRPYQNVNLYDILTETEVKNSYVKRKNALSKKAGRQKGRADRRPA
jgi:hypothetical protein